MMTEMKTMITILTWSQGAVCSRISLTLSTIDDGDGDYYEDDDGAEDSDYGDDHEDADGYQNDVGHNNLDPREQFARRRRDRGGRPVDNLGQGEDKGDEDGDGDCGNDDYYDNYCVENFARGWSIEQLGKGNEDKDDNCDDGDEEGDLNGEWSEDHNSQVINEWDASKKKLPQVD